MEDLLNPVECVACKPNQFAAAEPEGADVIKLLAQGSGGDAVGQANVRGAVVYLAGYMGLREVLPDELEHEELVKVGVEERAHDGIELPIVVMRAFGEVDVHGD